METWEERQAKGFTNILSELRLSEPRFGRLVRLIISDLFKRGLEMQTQNPINPVIP